MKKLFTFISLSALVILFAGCDKEPQQNGEEDNSNVSAKIGIAATCAEVAGESAAIGANAAATVFHAEAGGSSFVADGDFAYADGKFSGVLGKELAAEKKYDWYVLYPAANASSPAKAEISIAAEQKQVGASSMAHIPALMTYAGNAKGVAASEMPSVTLAPVAAVITVNATNRSGNPIVVNKVTVTTESVDLAGDFVLNFVTSTPRFSSTDKSVKSVSVGIDGGLQIADGASAQFNMAVKPGNVSTGEKLTITLAAGESNFVTTASLPQDLVLEAGKATVVEAEALSDKAPELALGTDAIVAVDEGGTYHVTVDANEPWTATTTDSWITIVTNAGEGPGTVDISLEANASGRDGYVVVKTAHLEAGFGVSQGWGTKIGDLIWAKYDLDTPGAFTGDYEVSGKFYQWNSKVAWPGGNEMGSPCPEGYPLGSLDEEGTPEMWEAENDPCPLGWHVPTAEQVRTLLGWDYEDMFHTDGYAPAVVKFHWHWYYNTQGAFVGNTDAETANKDDLKGNIYIPMCGYRGPEDGVINYISSTFLQTADRSGSWYGVGRPYYQIHWNGCIFGYAGPARQGMPVRCVAEISK